DSSIVKNGNPVFIPDFDTSFSGRFFSAGKISRLGTNEAERFASRYYSEVAPVIAIYADNLLSSLRGAGLPWTIATGFDKSLVVGNFVSYSEIIRTGHLTLEDSDCGKRELALPSAREIAAAVNEVSRYNSLKMGDLILLPIDSEPLSLKIDSLITIGTGNETLLKMPVR
ncbi:MAG: hypothetical protein K2J87_05635, partial [Muribaculaceae bacterium]|nr:hypothetical protein [Muribaculaceae bacterium]